MQFAPQAQGNPQTATYASVKEAIVKYIQKEYPDGQDVAESIEKGVVFDLKTVKPKRKISAEADVKKAATEQTGLDMESAEKLRGYRERESSLCKGLIRA